MESILCLLIGCGVLIDNYQGRLARRIYSGTTLSQPRMHTRRATDIFAVLSMLTAAVCLSGKSFNFRASPNLKAPSDASQPQSKAM